MGETLTLHTAKLIFVEDCVLLVHQGSEVGGATLSGVVAVLAYELVGVMLEGDHKVWFSEIFG